MQKNLEYKHSVRATVGNGHLIGWINTDESVDLPKSVKQILPNHKDQMTLLLQGKITEIDETKPTKKFFLGTKGTAKVPKQFLGYLETSEPSTPEVLENLWSKLVFTPKD